MGEGEVMDTPDDLIVPVYLNQRIVFDLVATLQGGLAQVTKVAQSQKVSGEASSEIGGNFGLSNVLSSLFRIDFSGKATAKGGGESATTSNEDRVHTPASLFMHLRSLLRSKQWLKSDSPSLRPKPADFVEFTATMQPNPLTELLDTFVEIMEMNQAFSGHTGKGKAASDPQKMKKQLQAMSTVLKSGTTSDLTTGLLESKYRSVITLENQYLNDPSMSDLADGTFRVIGKIIRVIDSDSDAISLNRKSVIGSLPDPVLRQFATVLQSAELREMRLPSLEWEIRGPVIQVLPVAIYA